MGYTNKTSHYDLPQWIAGDKPSWLGDVNTAMLNIDTAIAGADASATAAESSAAAANAQVQAQEAKITKNTTDIQALTEQLADVSGVANAALPKNGGTMTGALTLAGAPTQDLQAATKKYVDDNSGKGALMLSGGTMTGPLTLNAAPTADLMAATKKYVDDNAVTTPFKVSKAVSDAGFVISAAAVNGALVFSIIGSGTINHSAELAKCDGNPLGLTANQAFQYISFISDLKGTPIINKCDVKFDGTSTIITNRTNVTGMCFGVWTGKCVYETY